MGAFTRKINDLFKPKRTFVVVFKIHFGKGIEPINLKAELKGISEEDSFNRMVKNVKITPVSIKLK